MVWTFEEVVLVDEGGGLTDLCGVVNDSAAVNIAQPTGLEDGNVVVTTYEWQNQGRT